MNCRWRHGGAKAPRRPHEHSMTPSWRIHFVDVPATPRLLRGDFVEPFQSHRRAFATDSTSPRCTRSSLKCRIIFDPLGAIVWLFNVWTRVRVRAKVMFNRTFPWSHHGPTTAASWSLRGAPQVIRQKMTSPRRTADPYCLPLERVACFYDDQASTREQSLRLGLRCRNRQCTPS